MPLLIFSLNIIIIIIINVKRQNVEKEHDYTIKMWSSRFIP